jgi:hypothetical protein
MHHILLLVTVLMILGTGTVQANINAPYAVDANTIALYHFDEATGGVTPDAVGNHPGTLNGNAAMVPGGKFANGLGLDGSGDYVRLGNVHQNPAQSTAQGTVEAWVKLEAAPNSFVVLGSGTEYGNCWDDGWFLGRHSQYSSNLVFMIWSGGWQVADSGIAPESLVGGWHHLAGTWGAEGVQVWVDGVLQATNPAYTAGLSNTNYQTALVGADSWTWCTPGMVDEVRISDIQRDLAVPLPGTVWLLGSALLGVAGWRCRKG